MVDGVGAEHSSLHANMFALKFGLVQEDIGSVLEHIKAGEWLASMAPTPVVPYLLMES